MTNLEKQIRHREKPLKRPLARPAPMTHEIGEPG
jgi:hypothetical protein